MVPVEHNNGMSISSCHVVCVQSTDSIVGCTPLPRYSVHQGPAIRYMYLGINAQVASASAGLLAGLITYPASKIAEE